MKLLYYLEYVLTAVTSHPYKVERNLRELRERYALRNEARELQEQRARELAAKRTQKPPDPET